MVVGLWWVIRQGIIQTWLTRLRLMVVAIAATSRLRAKYHPDKIIALHCADCRKFSGSPFRAVAVIAADDV
jgi:hypothetical protein